MTDTTETEFKLRATRPLEVAAIDAALREIGAVCRAPSSSRHTDTYFDDALGSLAAAGIGLRLRADDTTRRVTCKARHHVDQGLFRREEVDAAWSAPTPPRTARDLPAALRDRLEPYVLARELQPVLQLTTRRDTRQLVQDDEVLGELAIDQVEAAAAGRSFAFMEVELEVATDLDGNRQVVDALLQRLPLQPADDDKPSHAAIGLGLRPGILVAALEPADARLGDALAARITRHLDALHAAETGVRADLAPEALHTMRVAVRRLRSLVRAFRDAWADATAEALLAALAELGRRLGTVRDLDVMLAELPAACAQLPVPLQHQSERTIAWVAGQRADANATLQAWLRSEERLAAQQALETALAGIDRHSPLAESTASAEVPARIAHAAVRLRRAIDAIAPELPFEPLHALRIACKRLRYVAEEFAELPGLDLDKPLGKVIALQQGLGVVCDHELAARRLLDWLRPAAAASADGALTAAALGGLATRHAMAATKARKRALALLSRVDRNRIWRRFASEAAPDAKLASGRQDDMRSPP